MRMVECGQMETFSSLEPRFCTFLSSPPLPKAADGAAAISPAPGLLERLCCGCLFFMVLSVVSITTPMRGGQGGACGLCVRWEVGRLLARYSVVSGQKEAPTPPRQVPSQSVTALSGLWQPKSPLLHTDAGSPGTGKALGQCAFFIHTFAHKDWKGLLVTLTTIRGKRR